MALSNAFSGEDKESESEKLWSQRSFLCGFQCSLSLFSLPTWWWLPACTPGPVLRFLWRQTTGAWSWAIVLAGCPLTPQYECVGFVFFTLTFSLMLNYIFILQASLSFFLGATSFCCMINEISDQARGWNLFYLLRKVLPYLKNN